MDIYTILGLIPIALLLFISIWEFLAFLALGPVKEKDQKVEEWLEDGVRSSPINDEFFLYKPLEYRHGTKINFIKKHRPTMLSKYYVDKADGNDFQILRGSPLHNKIEAKRQQLLNDRRNPHVPKTRLYAQGGIDKSNRIGKRR